MSHVLEVGELLFDRGLLGHTLNTVNYSPPHSVEAEKAVLGAALREPDTLNLVADKVKPDHFFLDVHRDIYTAMVELYHQNEPTDLLVVADKLRRSVKDSEYLGPAYLVELTEAAPVSQNIEYYAKLVREYYYLRRIIDACQTTVKKAMAFDGKVSGFIEDVEKEFLRISNEQDVQGISTAVEVLDSTLAEL